MDDNDALLRQRLRHLVSRAVRDSDARQTTSRVLLLVVAVLQMVTIGVIITD